MAAREEHPILPSPPPRALIGLLSALRAGLQRLGDLLVPPQLPLFERIAGVGLTQTIAAAARLRIADLLEGGPLSAAELSARTGLPEENLHRLLRALAAAGVFAYRRGDGRFRNNRLSGALRSQGLASLRDYADYFGSPANVLAWADFDRTLASGESAFARVHGMSVWSWFEAHPGEREIFAGAMVALTELFATGIAAAYPFAELRRLCDVGGGIGTLLASVLARHAHLEGVLFDGAGVVETAAGFLARRGVAARVERIAGSFFDAVPAGCDGYMLKNVLHDWDDQQSLRILGNCRRAMQPGQRLLVIESLVEKDTVRGLGALSDLHMMVVCDGGRERGRGEFERLYAGSGFRLSRVLPTALPVSVIEGIAV